MNDDTLIATLKEVGKHFLELQAEARKRGYQVHIETHFWKSSPGGDPDCGEVVVLKPV